MESLQASSKLLPSSGLRHEEPILFLLYLA